MKEGIKLDYLENIGNNPFFVLTKGNIPYTIYAMIEHSEEYIQAEITLEYIEMVSHSLRGLLQRLCDYSLSGIYVRVDDFNCAKHCINDAVSDLFYETSSQARRVITKEDKEHWQRLLQERKTQD